MTVLDYKWGRQGLSEGSLDWQFPSWKFWKISERNTKRNTKTGAPLELLEVPWVIAGAPWGTVAISFMEALEYFCNKK